MSGVTVTWDSRALEDAIKRLPGKVSEAVRDGVLEIAHIVELSAAEDAPHRDGRLAGSMRVSGPTVDGLKWSARIGPTVVYGRRIAIGFHGRDSIGRNYDQHGHIFMRPAEAKAVAQANPILRRHVENALGV